MFENVFFFFFFGTLCEKIRVKKCATDLHFLKIHCLDFTPIVFEVGSYWFRIGAYCYEAIIINNVFYCFCQGETFEKVRIFGSCLRRKQPSEYLDNTTFSPIFPCIFLFLLF